MLQIKIAGTSFTKFVRKIGMPYVDLASAYFLFGESEAKSIANLAPSGNGAGVVAGVPTYGAGFATLNNTAAIQCGATNSGPMTQLFVTRKKDINAQPHFGAYVSSLGFLLYDAAHPSATTSLQGAANAVLTPIMTQELSLTAFQLVALTYDGATLSAYQFNGAASPIVASTDGVTTIAAKTLAFGGWAPANATGFDVAMGMVFPSALTQAQLVDIYNATKPKLARRSIAML